MTIGARVTFVLLFAAGAIAASESVWARDDGAVVESVAAESAADKAGLRNGDLVQAWSRDQSKGKINSPFDLSWIEMEEGPRGAVTLVGSRNNQKHKWALAAGSWGLKTRPNFSGDMLTSYQHNEELATGGRALEAAAGWERAAEARPYSRWLTCWILFHAAERLEDSRQWDTADRIFQKALRIASVTGPEIVVQLFQARAHGAERRSDWNKAEQYYRSSGAVLQRLGAETLTSARNLQGLCNVVLGRGNLAAAEHFCQQALGIQERFAPGSLEVAATLSTLGQVARERGDLARGEEYCRKALRTQEDLVPRSMDIATTLNTLGLLAAQRGDIQRAQEYLDRALKLREQLAPGSREVGESLNGMGRMAWLQGDLARAEDYFRHALAIAKSLATESLDVARETGNLGAVAWQRGDLAKAEEYDRRALAIEEKLAPGTGVMATQLNNLGVVAFDRGDLQSAEQYFERSLAIKQKLTPDSLEVAANLTNVGNVAELWGDLAKAERYYGRALRIYQKLAPESPDLPAVLHDLGQVAEARRDLLKARNYFDQALQLEEKVSPERLTLAQTLNSLGDVAGDGGDLQQAETYYRKALEIAEKSAPGSLYQGDALAGLASVLRRRGELDSALPLFEQALNALESQTARLGGTEEIRSGFRARHAGYYLDYIDALMSSKRGDLAFTVMERLRARSLLEMLAAAHIDLQKGVAAGLIERERVLRRSLDAEAQLRTQLDSREELETANREIDRLVAEFQQVEHQIRVSSPAYAALTEPKPLSLQQVQHELLDGDTLLLEYALGDKRSYLWMIGTDSFATFELPKRSEIEALARRVYELLTVRAQGTRHETRARRANFDAEYSRALEKLSSILLGPIHAEIKGKRLVVVSDGALQYIPFSILPSPDVSNSPPPPLIVEHEIVNLPSASVLSVLRRDSAGRPQAKRTVAVLADPVFSREDPRVRTSAKNHVQALPSPALTTTLRSALLPGKTGADRRAFYLPRLLFSRREASAIMAMAPTGQVMEALDFDASRARATSPELAQYRVVHFATHGLLDGRHPELSALVFSLVDRQGRPQNGFLEMQDVYNLNLPVDLVVLSACQSALGKEIYGEGLIGMTRGFMYAGASRVVATLWSVDDVATAELMRQFYGAMFQQGLSPAAALRAAQVEMQKQVRWKDPYYWAGFVLEGEWKGTER